MSVNEINAILFVPHYLTIHWFQEKCVNYEIPKMCIKFTQTDRCGKFKNKWYKLLKIVVVIGKCLYSSLLYNNNY